MRSFALWLSIAAGGILAGADAAHAVRVMTSLPTQAGDPAQQFNNIAITPDGTKIIATALLQIDLTGDRVYAVTIPADPSTQVAATVQLSTEEFSVDQNYDVGFPPVISPNGQTILYTHDNATGSTNTIYKMPIAGELHAADFTRLFGGSNLVPPGNGNTSPLYSPDGATIFFLNSESGFEGTIPSFAGTPAPFAAGPDWDQLYRVPTAGGTPTAVTLPAHGDIDVGLFAVTPNGSSIVYASDAPIAERKDRGDMRPKLYTIPATGGTPSEIVMPQPGHDFSITNQLSISPNGQNVLFIGDYETLGKNELFSVPIGGGTPTRVSDTLPFGGDVYSFAIAPNGNSVAYAAGQNVSSNSELFLTPITGGTGNSVRVSDPIATNTGLLDVSTASDGGQIVFSPDSTRIFYLGDMNTENVSDLYVVDTTAKGGFVPKPYIYIGPSGGEFFNELNWEDSDGNNPPLGSIDPNVPIRQSLIIDGDTVVATVASAGAEINFQLGGSLEMTPGSSLTSVLAQVQFNPGSALKLTDATISVREDIILSGSNYLNGGLIESFADDVEFQDSHKSVINGTTLRSSQGIMVFDNSATSITGATFEMADRLSLRYEVDVTVVDTEINVNNGMSDVEDAFAGAQAAGSRLTLKGESTLLAHAIQDGVSLVLDDNSFATLLAGTADVDLVDSLSNIVFESTGAKLTTLKASGIDVRARIINGLTGLSYLADPSAWNITNWNGVSTITALQLASVGLAGDYNADGIVDAADYTVWRNNLNDPTEADLNNNGDGGEVGPSDYVWWKQHYGNTSPGAGGLSVAVPEPAAWMAALTALGACCSLRRRTSAFEL